jgi:hypothetical protein
MNWQEILRGGLSRIPELLRRYAASLTSCQVGTNKPLGTTHKGIGCNRAFAS